MTFNLTKNTLATSVGLVLVLSTSSAIAATNTQYQFSENEYGSHEKIKARNVESKDIKLNIKADISYEGAICSFDFNNNAGFDVDFGKVKINNSQNNTLDTRETDLLVTGNGCDMAFFKITNTSVQPGSTTNPRYATPNNNSHWGVNGHTWYTLGDDLGVWFTTVIKKKDTAVTASMQPNGSGEVLIQNGYEIKKYDDPAAEWHRLKEFTINDTLTLTTIMNIDHRKYAMWNNTADIKIDKVMAFTAKIQ
ncbi:hypothetical protein [Vibrio barjaei]|uniref:hypothetical protein n=1 Tax=Vibrio barjaei TaxID=1676683 RepID=UPI0022833961|nr:hypothetical protein [Vibrio barjaei]MCY9872497.1 hypothetical protein [Vibrio barjaei]